jgi:hypothetical protein
MPGSGSRTAGRSTPRTGIEPMKSDTTAATDPQSAADCLAYCRSMLTDDQYRLACAIIELYAQSQRVKGIAECRVAVREWLAKGGIARNIQ